MTASKVTTTPASPGNDPLASKEEVAGWLMIPEPLRHVFDQFPLKTHASLKLPQRSPKSRSQHVLYLFASESTGELSCNPACLKWQAYLKFSGVPFTTVSSNNHASPSGSLPFIIPSVQTANRPASPIPANKISKWVSSQVGKDSHGGMRDEAYSSLLDYRIRNAWLHTLYLDDANFEAIARPLYISSASSNRLVQLALAYQLRRAAREELLKTSTTIDEEELYSGAEKAFEALSALLGEGKTYSGNDQPGLFDASVFAYTHLILNKELQWRNTRLRRSLQKFKNLIAHQEQLDLYLRG